MTDMITLPNIDPSMIANNLVVNNPTHPGEFLQEELEARGISETKLAEEVGMKVSTLKDLIKGKLDFTIEYALLIEAAIGVDADYWINLQTNYNKAKVKHDSSFMAHLSKIRRIAAVL